MTGVLRSFRRPRSRLLLVAACLALTSQAVATLLAPVAEARASHSAPAHVEAAGTHQHYSHNPTDCAACIALQITGLPQRAVASQPVPTARYATPPAAARRAATPARLTPNNPRAPPIIPAPVR